MLTKTRRLLVSLCAVALSVVSSNAMVLVDEGVVLGEGGYSSTVDKTSFSVNTLTGGLTASTGFATDYWLGTTGVLVSRTAGLAFPSDFTGKMDSSGAGALGFRGESGAANWNASSGQAQSDNYRNQYRKTVALNGAAGEKRYFRALVYADSKAMNELYQKDGWLSWRNAYNVGLVTPISEMAYSTSVMDCPRYLHFSCYRNTSVSPAVNEIAFVVKGKERTAKRFKVCSMTAGHTYLCVAEATLGDGPDTFRVFAYDCSSSTPLDMDNLPWVACEFEGVTFDLFDSSDDLHLFIGGQYKTTGDVRFDEMRVGTTLNDVVPVSAKYVTVGTMSVDNLTTVSADLSAGIEMKGVASAVPELSYGLSESELTEKTTLSAITADGTVTVQLTGLQPVTTYYYQWRVTADGVNPAEGPVSSFVTKGMPVLGEMTVGGSPATGGTYAQVMLTEAGLTATRVECWCGTSEETMTLLQAWDGVASGTELVATNTAAAFGTTDYFKFKATFEYQEELKVTETPVKSLTLSGTAAWIGAKSAAETATSWTDAANWDILTVPNEKLDVLFSKNGYVTAEDEALAGKTLKLNSKVSAVLAFTPETTLSVGSIDIGHAANVNDGSLIISNGTVNVTGAVHVPTDKLKSSYNTLSLVGTTLTAGGAFAVNPNTDGCSGNKANLSGGSVLTAGSMDVSRASTLTVSASVVTNSGSLVVGNLGDGTVSIVDNSTFVQKGSTVNIAQKGSAVFNVLRGSSFLADSKTVNLGGGADQGYNGTITISNGLFRAGTLNAPQDSRYTRDYVINVRGETGKLELTGDLNVCSPTRNYREAGSSTLNVEGGEVAVGGTLAFGSSADKRKNYFNLSGASAKVTVASVECATNAVIKITVPATGFANTLVEATDNIAFSSNAAIRTPIKIDATACKSGAWQTLFKAGGEIKNLTDDTLAAMVTVTGTYKDRESELKLVKDESGKVKELKFRVKNGGLMLLVK